MHKQKIGPRPNFPSPTWPGSSPCKGRRPVPACQVAPNTAAANQISASDGGQDSAPGLEFQTRGSEQNQGSGHNRGSERNQASENGEGSEDDLSGSGSDDALEDVFPSMMSTADDDDPDDSGDSGGDSAEEEISSGGFSQPADIPAKV